MYRIKDWIDKNRISYSGLSSNHSPYAIDILEGQFHHIDWNCLSSNPYAATLIEKKLKLPEYKYRLFKKCEQEICIYNEKTNKTIIWNKYLPYSSIILELFERDLLTEEMLVRILTHDIIIYIYIDSNRLNFNDLLKNPSVSLIEKEWDWNEVLKNEDKIDFIENIFSDLIKEADNTIDFTNLNYNINAINLLLKYPEYINFDKLSSNKNACGFLSKYPQYINWNELCRNENAMEILLQYPEQINWNILSSNKGAIDLLRENTDKINYYELSKNSGIFDEDEYYLK